MTQIIESVEDFSFTSTNLGSVISEHFPKEKKNEIEFLSLKFQRSVVLKLELIQLPLV